MGVSCILSRGGELSPPLGNPKPWNFSIRKVFSIDGNNFAVLINYPDANNYEGNKILVYKNYSYNKFRTLTNVDPHFSNDGSPSPFARFEPTVDGWKSATKLVDMLTAGLD